MCVFQVNEQQLKKQLDEITYIIKLRDNLTPKAGTVRAVYEDYSHVTYLNLPSCDHDVFT